eukprot:scaffold102995_cov29-Tisochrysis_lutea.AAC.2
MELRILRGAAPPCDVVTPAVILVLAPHAGHVADPGKRGGGKPREGKTRRGDRRGGAYLS